MADKMLRIAGRGEDGLARAIKTDINGNLKVTPVNKSISVELSLNAKSGPTSYNFITSLTESKGNAIKIAGYKYIDVFLVAETAHSFRFDSPMYQRVYFEGTTATVYKSAGPDLAFDPSKYSDFVREYKPDSLGGEAIFIKEMRVFGNYLELSLYNNSDILQKYLLLINLYN